MVTWFTPHEHKMQWAQDFRMHGTNKLLIALGTASAELIALPPPRTRGTRMRTQLISRPRRIRRAVKIVARSVRLILPPRFTEYTSAADDVYTLPSHNIRVLQTMSTHSLLIIYECRRRCLHTPSSQYTSAADDATFKTLNFQNYGLILILVALKHIAYKGVLFTKRIRHFYNTSIVKTFTLEFYFFFFNIIILFMRNLNRFKNIEPSVKIELK